MVSDSYDIFKACKHIWGDKLKERVMERSEDSALIIRPDSGDPAETLIEVCVSCTTCVTSGGMFTTDLKAAVSVIELYFSEVKTQIALLEAFSSTVTDGALNSVALTPV